MASMIYQMYNQWKAEHKVRLFGEYAGYGPGEHTRDFVYVKDVVKVNFYFWDHPEISGIFNCGTGHAHQFNTLAKAVLNHFGSGELEYVPFPEVLNKKLVVLLTAAMMLFGSQATAFAYVDQGTEAAQEESTTETEEPVVEDTHTEENGDPFSVPGNGEVRDDITDDSSKEFLTIKTKNNNTFYIVIDRAATTNNVYMLSQIDENDLKEFLDEDQQQTLETAPSVVLEDEHTDDTESSMVVEEETQADKPDKTATNSGLFVILLLAVAGIAGYYYFKIYKPKQEDDDSENEGLEMDDGLETINEDEESDNPEEKVESQE